MIALIALTLACAPATIRLWEGDAPGALGKSDKDVPTITRYEPEKPCGAAVIVCPGGGYGGLADHEGKDYAEFLNTLGITAFVLKYRLGSNGYRHPVMLWDAARAVRTVRYMALQWNLNPNRIGIMGSSAGGHLAATMLTKWDLGLERQAVDRESSRPDFGILCYPVITMGPLSHAGSRANLLGEKPGDALINELSAERHVTVQTPPCFIWHTLEDSAVPPENSMMFAEALRKAKVACELHLFEKGSHGIGLANGHPWTVALAAWLRSHGWAS